MRRDATTGLQPAAEDPSGVAKNTLDVDASLLDAQIANARVRVTLAALLARLSA